MRTFTRKTNRSATVAGNKVRAADVNELQQAIEDMQTGALAIPVDPATSAALAGAQTALASIEVIIESIPEDVSQVANMRIGIYNIQDEGATGDGATDDRVNIQNAYIAAYEAGGGEVYWPAGDYYMEPRSGFAYSSLKLYLWVFGSNITTRFHPKARIKIREGHANGWVIFGGAKNVAPADIDTQDWGDLEYTYLDNFDEAFEIYPIEPAAFGDARIELATSADCDNFAVGDAIFPRSGNTVVSTPAAQPDAEMNEVVAISPPYLYLKYPLAKDYAQEYFPDADMDTATSTTSSAWPAPLGVQNIESVTSRNIHYQGVTFDVQQTDGVGFGMVHTSVLDYSIRGSRGSLVECSLQSAGPYRGFTLRDNLTTHHWESGSQVIWTADRGCGDIDSGDNTYIMTGDVGLYHIHEGVFNVHVAGDRILNKAGQNTSNDVIQVRGRGYDIAIEDNYIFYDNAGAGEAVFVDDTIKRGRVINNHFPGNRGATVSGEDFRVASNTGKGALIYTPIYAGSETIAEWMYHDSDASILLPRIPLGYIVTDIKAFVHTPFNGTSPSFTLGIDGGYHSAFAPTVSLATNGYPAITRDAYGGFVVTAADGDVPEITLAAGGSSAGRAVVMMTICPCVRGSGV